MRKAPQPSRQGPAAARRPALLSAARLGRLARRLDGVMGEINPYLGALAIGLLVLNLAALLLLAPYLRLRHSAYFPGPAPACAAGEPSPVATVNAAMRSGT